MGDTYYWKSEDIARLIKIRIKRNDWFEGKRGTAKHGWVKLAAELQCVASADQCKKKWQNLVARYKEIATPRTGDGLEEEDHEAENWPYFEAINSFMSERHVMKPALLINSVSATSGTMATTSSAILNRDMQSSRKNYNSSSPATAHSDSSENSDNYEPVIRQKKKRRTVETNLERVTMAMIASMNAQLERSREEQEHARQTERTMMKILTKFMDKK